MIFIKIALLSYFKLANVIQKNLENVLWTMETSVMPSKNGGLFTPPVVYLRPERSELQRKAHEKNEGESQIGVRIMIIDEYLNNVQTFH